MPTDEQINSLIMACNRLLESQTDSNERLVRVEINGEVMQKAMTELLESQKDLNVGILKMSETTIKMEGEISRIEEKLLEQIKSVKKDYTELSLKLSKDREHSNKEFGELEDYVKGLSGRIQVMELYKTGVEATKAAEDKFKGWFASNWFNLIKTILTFSTAIAIGMYIYKNLQGG